MNVYPYHRCVFVSDIHPADGKIVMIRLTSLSEKWEDHCVLDGSDYEDLDRLTVPAFPTTLSAAAQAFQDMIDAQEMRVLQPVPQACLKKIIQGMHESDHVPLGILRRLPVL